MNTSMFVIGVVFFLAGLVLCVIARRLCDDSLRDLRKAKQHLDEARGLISAATITISPDAAQRFAFRTLREYDRRNGSQS